MRKRRPFSFKFFGLVFDNAVSTGQTVSGSNAFRRSSRVAASGSPFPNTAEPATIHSAPWRTTLATLLNPIPPSTSMWTFRPRASIILRSRVILSRVVPMNDCPPNPGLTDGAAADRQHSHRAIQREAFDQHHLVQQTVGLPARYQRRLGLVEQQFELGHILAGISLPRAEVAALQLEHAEAQVFGG